MSKELQEKYPYLNEVEIEELMKLAENKTLQNAINKLVLKHVYVDGQLNKADPETFGENLILAEMAQPLWDNSPISEYGTHVKTLVNATKLVKTGLHRIEEFKKVEPVKETAKNRGK
jgi:hypothetical protein